MATLDQFYSALPDLAARWQIRELAVVGSGTRGGVGPDRSLTLLVDFDADEEWSLQDLARLKVEMEDFAHRPVALVERGALVNPYCRRIVLCDARTLYACDRP